MSKKKIKIRKTDSNKYPKPTTIENGFIIEKETKRKLAECVSFYFKDVTLYSICFEDFEKEMKKNMEYRVYLSSPRNQINIIRIIKPLPGINIGYTLEEFKHIIQEEKNKKKSAFKNAKKD